jgi:hypothetical protein
MTNFSHISHSSQSEQFHLGVISIRIGWSLVYKALAEILYATFEKFIIKFTTYFF